MLEIRLFATFREGRGKIIYFPATDHPTGESIINKLGIPADEVAILLINGKHSRPTDAVVDGDVIALFPPVGGG